MYISYDLSLIKRDDSEVLVKARVFEGDFEDVTTMLEDEEITENIYRNKNLLYEISKKFPPETTDDEIKAWLMTNIGNNAEGRTLLWT